MAEQMDVAEPQTAGAQTYYSRRASGLVKSIGFWSNIALSLSFMAVPFFVISATSVPASFPGADPFWSSVIAAVICIVPAMLWAYFLVVMPRTGGDYVFVSRSIHPWIGFASNFSFAIWILLGAGYVGALIGADGLSPGFAAIGTLTHNHTLLTWSADLTTKGWAFGFGALTLVVSAGLMMLPTRRMLQIMKVILVLSLLGLIISFFVLLVSSRHDFVNAVTRYGGNYAKIVKDGGFTATSTRFNPTFVGIAVAAVAFLYPFLGVYGGGELRSAKTSGRRAIYGALVIAAILTLPIMFLADHVIGVKFLGAATTLGAVGSKNYPFTPAPFYFFFASMLTHQTWLIVIMNLSVAISLLALGPPSLFMCARSLFAWSFDHITPTKLSTVSKRTHAPVLASAVMLVVGISVLAVSIFAARTLLSLVFTAILAQLISFVVLGVAGIVFPYRRRDLYSHSPVRRSVAGVPLMSIVAAVSTAFFGLLVYWYASRSVLLANTQTGWITIGVIWAVGLSIYPASKWLNQRRGIDLGVSFKALPPE